MGSTQLVLWQRKSRP